jgi:hypothetical protein
MRRTLLALLLAALALPIAARVISYAPYSDRISTPALQSRLNRHFALIETDGGVAYNNGVQVGQLVVYDSAGLEEPRVVFPPGGGSTTIQFAGVREEGNDLALLVQSECDCGVNPTRKVGWFLSTNGGGSWTRFTLPNDSFLLASTTSANIPYIDRGGPTARSFASPVRTGTRDVPFVIARTGDVYAVQRDATARLLTTGTNLRLTGTNADHTKFVLFSDSVKVLALDGTITNVGPKINTVANESWIAADGSVYDFGLVGYDLIILLPPGGFSYGSLARYSGGVRTEIASGSSLTLAIPTFDFNGAWTIERTGSATVLSKVTAESGKVPQWTDTGRPEVEALHAGVSGKTVLVQVHRVRNLNDPSQFRDPALAVWHTGDPAPVFYDELFMNERDSKGFVHVDPDAVENGTPFVFDSGVTYNPIPVAPVSPPPVSGGSEVIQEWGVVKASLAQKLVLPGVGRTPGAFGSFWRTDITFYNPSDAAQHVNLRFVPTGAGMHGSELNESTLTLAGHEIRAVKDALQSIFGLEQGNGSVFITPEPGGGVSIQARTYNTTPKGTYGYDTGAIDIYAAASPRFPVSFAGAFFGGNFRTNLILTDVSGRGGAAELRGARPSGYTTTSPAGTAATPALGQQQLNGIKDLVGLSPTENGGLEVKPLSGEQVASVIAIDNLTNDPTWVQPGLPTSTVRTIPVIGHLAGANGSQFRTDLYLFNPTAASTITTLQMNKWDSPTTSMTKSYTLGPHQTLLLPDVLFSVFGHTGLARLRVSSVSNTGGVRATTHTYTLDAGGGTYGCLMPPLNSFQSAGPGDTLEILGASTGTEVRTNLGLVDLNQNPTFRIPHVFVTVIDKNGTTIDSIPVTLISAGGIQLNDLFRNRGIAPEVGPVLIRVTSVDGLIGAYASVVQNDTNDPSYLPASLGAH